MPIDTAKTSMDETHTNTLTKGIVAKSTAVVLTVSMSIAAALTPGKTLAASNSARALENPLVPFSATYRIGNNVVHAGNARVELEQREDDEWHYSLSTKPTGLFKLAGKGYVTESSTFSVIDDNNQSILEPKSYKFRQDNENKRAIDATFNWGQMQLYFSRGADNKQTTLSAATLDRMTMILTLMSTLKVDFESFTLEVFDGGRIKQLQIANEGTEILTTSLGALEAVRVKTSNVESSRRATVTWFAPALNNLPVQIEQHKDGKLVARLSVSDYTQQ